MKSTRPIMRTADIFYGRLYKQGLFTGVRPLRIMHIRKIDLISSTTVLVPFHNPASSTLSCSITTAAIHLVAGKKGL